MRCYCLRIHVVSGLSTAWVKVAMFCLFKMNGAATPDIAVIERNSCLLQNLSSMLKHGGGEQRANSYNMGTLATPFIIQAADWFDVGWLCPRARIVKNNSFASMHNELLARKRLLAGFPLRSRPTPPLHWGEEVDVDRWPNLAHPLCSPQKGRKYVSLFPFCSSFQSSYFHSTIFAGRNNRNL